MIEHQIADPLRDTIPTKVKDTISMYPFKKAFFHPSMSRSHKYQQIYMQMEEDQD